MELEVQEGKSTTTASPKKKTNVCSINIRDVKSVKEWVDRQTDDAKEWSDKGKFEFVRPWAQYLHAYVDAHHCPPAVFLEIGVRPKIWSVHKYYGQNQRKNTVFCIARFMLTNL